MRVFVAGASGVVGQPLVRRLVAAGHEVTGSTRKEAIVDQIESLGASATVCDALDADSIRDAVASAAPEVVVNQLTNFPAEGNQRDPEFFSGTDEVRRTGGRNLLEAAQNAGARRFVTQSLAFMYLPTGSRVKDEKAPTAGGFPGRIGATFQIMLDHERLVAEAEGIEGLILRYGFFYGPGTFYSPDGMTAAEVRKRRYPIVGPGTGVLSFIHVDDAAAAALAATERGQPGIYNVVDDEPAPMTEWLPVYAESLGAKPPRRVPVWLARLVAGKELTASAIGMRGADNSKAKSELGWEPAHPSWRQGFFDAN